MRELGYNQWERQVDPTDFVKFGKRMYSNDRSNNFDIMEAHLKQMRENMAQAKLNHESKKKQEYDFLS